MQLELTSEDRAVLERLLEHALSEMRVEVRRTSTPRYHDDLLGEQERLKALQERLRDLGA